MLYIFLALALLRVVEELAARVEIPFARNPR